MYFSRGSFRVNGDVVDVFLAYADHAVRLHFWGNEIERIETIDPEHGTVLHTFESLRIYPANLFVTGKDTLQQCIWEIQQDMVKQVQWFNEQGRFIEGKRLEERTTHDLEMMRELGFCSGIENYSRYLSGREPGEPPPCLFDYLPSNALLIVDESHVTGEETLTVVTATAPLAELRGYSTHLRTLSSGNSQTAFTSPLSQSAARYS